MPAVSLLITKSLEMEVEMETIRAKEKKCPVLVSQYLLGLISLTKEGVGVNGCQSICLT